MIGEDQPGYVVLDVYCGFTLFYEAFDSFDSAYVVGYFMADVPGVGTDLLVAEEYGQGVLFADRSFFDHLFREEATEDQDGKATDRCCNSCKVGYEVGAGGCPDGLDTQRVPGALYSSVWIFECKEHKLL